MRAQQVAVGVNIQPLLPPRFGQDKNGRAILMIRNLDGVNKCYLQSGISAGHKSDFFPLYPGETFMLDPVKELSHITQDAWWIYADGAIQVSLFEG